MQPSLQRQIRHRQTFRFGPAQTLGQRRRHAQIHRLDRQLRCEFGFDLVHHPVDVEPGAAIGRHHIQRETIVRARHQAHIPQKDAPIGRPQIKAATNKQRAAGKAGKTRITDRKVQGRSIGHRKLFAPISIGFATADRS